MYRTTYKQGLSITKNGIKNSAPPTNVMFTKAGLQNAEVSVSEGNNFRIAIRGEECGRYIDLANTTLNFNLNIPVLVQSTLQGWVPNYSVADIFSVSSVSLDGINLSLSKQEEQDQLLRKVLYYCDGRDSDLRSSRTGNMEDVIEMKQLDVNGYFLGVKPEAENLSIIERNPVRFIYSAENRRKTRLFNRLYTVTGQVLSNIATDSPLSAFSVKLSDLCPQLASLTIVDTTKLLQGQGLQINIRLLPAPQCMSGYLLETTGTSALLDLFKVPSYTITNVHLGVIQHQIPQDIPSSPVSFMTYQGLNYAFSQGVTNVNLNFSLPVNDIFVRGLVVMFTPTGGRALGGATGGSNGATSVILAKGGWDTNQASFTSGQISYSQYKAVDNTQIMINGVQYPRSGAVVPKSCVQLQQALYSQEIFGHSYAPSFQRFMTIDHCLFYPVNDRIKGGVVIQFYQSYLQAMTDMTLQILVICDRVLAHEGGQVLVE